jgi:hypothetical protein
MEQVARMGAMRSAHKTLVGKLLGRDYSEDPEADCKIILEWILGK